MGEASIVVLAKRTKKTKPMKKVTKKGFNQTPRYCYDAKGYARLLRELELEERRLELVEQLVGEELVRHRSTIEILCGRGCLQEI